MRFRKRPWFFATDLHGSVHRYDALIENILKERPEVVFLGGDLLPLIGHFAEQFYSDFFNDFLRERLQTLRKKLGKSYPKILFILGNDDPKVEEENALELEKLELWTYIQDREISTGSYTIFGYAYVPPTPFWLKDWEKYDVSRYVDPGCLAPGEGAHSTSVSESELQYATIETDLRQIARGKDLTNGVFLFHTPPYKTNLDRADLDNKMIDHAALDVHVGSIAVRRFIETRQPLLTLHGHIHESARITGSWKDKIGRTLLFSAAHDGPELALIRFHPENLEDAQRDLL